MSYDKQEETPEEMLGLANGAITDNAIPDVTDLTRPLLADPREKGIKRVGLVYSPRKSWWAGVVLVVLSVAIFVITIVTAIL